MNPILSNNGFSTCLTDIGICDVGYSDSDEGGFLGVKECEESASYKKNYSPLRNRPYPRNSSFDEPVSVCFGTPATYAYQSTAIADNSVASSNRYYYTDGLSREKSLLVTSYSKISTDPSFPSLQSNWKKKKTILDTLQSRAKESSFDTSSHSLWEILLLFDGPLLAFDKKRLEITFHSHLFTHQVYSMLVSSQLSSAKRQKKKARKQKRRGYHLLARYLSKVLCRHTVELNKLLSQLFLYHPKLWQLEIFFSSLEPVCISATVRHILHRIFIALPFNITSLSPLDKDRVLCFLHCVLDIFDSAKTIKYHVQTNVSVLQLFLSHSSDNYLYYLDQIYSSTHQLLYKLLRFSTLYF